jgi:hypothetical protein
MTASAVTGPAAAPMPEVVRPRGRVGPDVGTHPRTGGRAAAHRLAEFYLGTHLPNWLAKASTPPLFISHRRLARYRRLPHARTRWALDSGGFSELSMYGQWRTSPADYVDAVYRYVAQIGRLEWAAPQDWMCEPVMLARTGLSVPEHQHRTVANFLELQALWKQRQDDYPWRRHLSCPFVPVLQGWTLKDYWRCVDLYDQAGIQLSRYRLVGLGSICRRQATGEIGMIVRSLGAVLPLHGFGCKTAGLARYGRWLASADSMAWSVAGRRKSGCTPGHRSEANCLRYALAWRERVLAALARNGQHEQLDLFASAAIEPVTTRRPTAETNRHLDVSR